MDPTTARAPAPQARRAAARPTRSTGGQHIRVLCVFRGSLHSVVAEGNHEIHEAHERRTAHPGTVVQRPLFGAGLPTPPKCPTEGLPRLAHGRPSVAGCDTVGRPWHNRVGDCTTVRAVDPSSQRHLHCPGPAARCNREIGPRASRRRGPTRLSSGGKRTTQMQETFGRAFRRGRETRAEHVGRPTPNSRETRAEHRSGDPPRTCHASRRAGSLRCRTSSTASAEAPRPGLQTAPGRSTARPATNSATGAGFAPRQGVEAANRVAAPSGSSNARPTSSEKFCRAVDGFLSHTMPLAGDHDGLAVDLRLGRVAADPVDVGQHVGGSPATTSPLRPAGPTWRA